MESWGFGLNRPSRVGQTLECSLNLYMWLMCKFREQLRGAVMGFKVVQAEVGY
jgi:hypothetical protein